ncbi:MAG TPA: redox-sensing transcriptional repressor Rex [Limnochordia bacterium]
MRWKKISDAVVRRLPLYLRVLEEVSRDEDRKLMSSQELGERAGVSPALVRKDLAWFGEFGKQGVGYEIPFLKQELRRIMNLEQEIRVALVGVGSLGHALARYNKKRYMEDPTFNVRIIALFDSDPKKFGERVDGLEIWPIDTFEEKVKELGIRMAIIAVPSESAQEALDRIAAAGIKAVLNFAPTKLVVPPGVHLANADLSLEMQRLSYYLSE